MATHTAADPAPPRGLSAHAVSRAFQLRYIVRLGVAVACGAAAAVAVLYVLLARNLVGYAENFAILSAVRGGVVTASALSALLQVAITGAMVTAMALFASHKIAGPAARLNGMLRRVAEGRLPGTVRFRRGDQVGKLESRFNAASDLLHERHEALRRKLGDVRTAEQQLGEALAGSESDEQRQTAARALRVQADELAALLAAAGASRAQAPSR